MSTLTPTTGIETPTGEAIALDLLSTDTEVLLHLDRGSVLAAAGNGDVADAIRNLLDARGMKATYQAVVDAAERYTNDAADVVAE